jgi:hypothetical protein
VSLIKLGAGFWSVPCYSVKRIELSFDGNRFAIHPDDFYLGRVSAGSTACVAGVLSIGNGLPPNLAIIGDVFLKSCGCAVVVYVDTDGRLIDTCAKGILHTITATGGEWVCGQTQTTTCMGGVKSRSSAQRPSIIIYCGFVRSL